MNLSAVSFTVVTRILVLAAGFAASVFTARGLGVEGRGQYYAVMTLAAILAQFGNLGLSSSNTFLAARERAHSWALLVNSVWVAVGLGLLTTLAAIFFGDLLSARLGVPRSLAWTLCFIAPAILAFTLCSAVLVANERFFALNAWSIVNALLVLVGVAICTSMRAGSEVFVLVTLVAAVSAALGLIYDLGRKLDRHAGWAFDGKRMRASLQFASRAYLALLAGFLIQRIGVTLLMAYRGPSDIGVFSIAAQISDVLIILPSSMAMVLFPTLIRDPSDAWRQTRQAVLIVGGIMLAAGAGVWLLGEPIIKLVFGAQFAPSFHVLLWLLPAVLSISISSILSQYVVSEGFPQSLVALWIVGLGVCVFAGIGLVSAKGPIGAAQAQSIGAVAVCLGVVALTLRRRRNSLKSEARV
jgi:O-antigen/teichoic acid export membrane protein